MKNNITKISRRSRLLRIFWKRNFAVLLTVPLFAAAMLYAVLIEPEQCAVTYRVYSSNAVPAELDGFRLVFAADIHAKDQHIPRLQKIVDQINSLQPDLILLGGDFVNGNGKCTAPDELLDTLKKLSAPYGVYAVPGNHDYRYGIELVEEAFKKSPIRLLRDEKLLIKTVGNCEFSLVGLDYQLNPHQRVNQKRLTDLLSGNQLNLVVTHTPVDWEHLPDNAALTLAGHTHGGQINLPFLGSLINPQGYGRNLSYGEKYSGNKTLFITSGLNSAYNRARFCMKPEILAVTLKSPDKK